MAAARCAVTDSPELLRRTVSRPSHAWKPTSRTAAIERWTHSIQALGSSSGGMTWPWQSGQSGQPMPESVARTITPIVTSSTVMTTVARASFWNRVTAGPFYVAAAETHAGYPHGDAPLTARPRAPRRPPGRGLRCLACRSRWLRDGRVIRPVREHERERHPGHRELAPGPGREPVRVLVPRPEDERACRVPG